MALTLIKYPLDLTGTQPTNLIQGETVRIPRTTGRHFAPQSGPFFANSVRLRKATDDELLTLDVDYQCVYLYEYASYKAGQAITAVISIINPNIHGDLIYDYQVVGGEFSTNVNAIQLLIDNLALDNRVVEWDNVLDKPITFPPSPHLHHVGDWYGMEELIDVIQDLIDAITTGSEDLYDQLNIRFDNLITQYQTQQGTIGSQTARLVVLENQSNAHTQALANLLNQLNESATATMRFIRYIPITAPMTLTVNRRYIVLSDVSITLPTTLGLLAGDAIELEFIHDIRPIITVNNVGTQRLRRRNVEDTSLQYDGYRPKLTFIYVGDNKWEVRI